MATRTAPPEATSGATGRRSRGRFWRVAVGMLTVTALVVAGLLSSRGALEPGSVRDIGPLPHPAGWVRDGGQSVLVGSRDLWTFGDTLFPSPASDGSHIRTNTAAWSDPAHAVALHDAVDSNGAPVQFIPFTRFESEDNARSGRNDDRIAVWPRSSIALGDGSATVFFQVVKVSPGALNYRVLGSGIATASPGAIVATRDPGMLFRVPDPVFAAGAVRAGGFVFVYGCGRIHGLRFGCRVARVPAGRVHVRKSYRFWDGHGWAADIGAAVFVLRGPSGGLSVSWNPWLGRYLAVYNLPLSNRVMIRTAARPEGPWSPPRLAFTGRPTPRGMFDYAAFEHPELARDGGRTITISYFHPVGRYRGELRLVQVTLA